MRRWLRGWFSRDSRLNPKDWMVCGAAAMPALGTQLLWLLTNTELPVSDATGPLRSSWEISHYFLDHDWLRALYATYFVRDWRPTGFYLLEVPFQIVSGGNLMFTAATVSLLCTAVTSIYFYYLFRLALSWRFALLATGFLGFLPGVQWPSTLFAFSEDALLPAVLASIYHMICSDYLRRRGHTIGFVLAVATAFIIRPVEAATHLGLPVVVFVLVMSRKRIITWSQIYWLIVGAFVSLLMLIAGGVVASANSGAGSFIYDDPHKARIFRNGSILVVAITVALLVWPCIRRIQKFRPKPPYILTAFLIIYSLVVCFYLGVVPKLVTWLYATSSGHLVVNEQAPGIATRLISYLQVCGIVAFCGVTIVAACSFALCLSSDTHRKLINDPLLYMLAIPPLTFALVLLSPQWFPRKVPIAISALYFVGLLVALLPGRWLHWRAGVVAAIGIAQGTASLLISNGAPLPSFVGLAFGAAGFPAMSTARPTPTAAILNFLDAEAQRFNLKTIGIPIDADPRYDAVNAFTLALASISDQSIKIRFIYTEKTTFSETEMLEYIGNVDGLFLVNDTDGRFRYTVEETSRLRALTDAETNVNRKIDFALLTMATSGTLFKLGFEKQACVTFAGDREGCLYTRISGNKAN